MEECFEAMEWTERAEEVDRRGSSREGRWGVSKEEPFPMPTTKRPSITSQPPLDIGIDPSNIDSSANGDDGVEAVTGEVTAEEEEEEEGVLCSLREEAEELDGS